MINSLKSVVTEGLKPNVSDADRLKAVEEASTLECSLKSLQKDKVLLLAHERREEKLDFSDFEAWLDDNGVNREWIRFEYIDSLGCNGVVCKKAAKATQEVIRIPSRLILSAENLCSSRTGQVWKNIIANDDLLAAMPQLSLVIALMSEVYLLEASFFHP